MQRQKKAMDAGKGSCHQGLKYTGKKGEGDPGRGELPPEGGYCEEGRNEAETRLGVEMWGTLISNKATTEEFLHERERLVTSW